MILEFNKNKKMVTPWNIVTYGEKVNLQLEFDLPVSPCYQSINDITLNVYKKNQSSSVDGLLLTVNNFILLDQTTWSGSIRFVGDLLLEYVQSLADKTAVLDGEFIFQVGGNKIIKSQVFYIKLYECPGPIPPSPDYITAAEAQILINDSIEIHNTSTDAHKDLLSKYATIEYVDSKFVSTMKYNIIDLVDLISKDNHYTYDPISGYHLFDIDKDGQIIYINNVSSDINILNLKFTNLPNGQEFKVYVNKSDGFNMIYFNNTENKVVFESGTPPGYYVLAFNIINNQIMLDNIFKGQ